MKRHPGEIISKVAFLLIIANIIIWIIRELAQIYLPTPFFALAALICGIIGWVKSKKSGRTNRFAMSATLISSILFILGFIFGFYNFIQNSVY